MTPLGAVGTAFRAFNKGALGMIHVEGETEAAVFSGQVVNRPYEGEPLAEN